MAGKRKGLGRGLDALLSPAAPAKTAPDAETPAEGKAAAATDGDLRNIGVDLLDRGRYQPRLDMRTDSLNELADSIRAQGVVQPIVVRPVADGRYEIIAGERRWRAAQIAGLQEVPAVVRDVPDSAAVAMALIENIQRENLNPLEEARALERLLDEFDMTHAQAAEAVGRSRAAVSNLLRLLDLEDDVKTLVERRELEMGHARALLGLDGRRQVDAARRVVSKGLSVRETERLVKRVQAEASSPTPPRARPSADPDIQRLEHNLSEKLGARVKIKHSRTGKGALNIAYNSLDELEGILSHLK